MISYSPWMSRLALSMWRPFLKGKTIIIGLTDSAADGTLEGYRQIVGKIATIDPKRGISVLQDDGQYYFLPPDHRPIKRARKGEYRLRSTGRIVSDPDYLCNYVVTKPATSP